MKQVRLKDDENTRMTLQFFNDENESEDIALNLILEDKSGGNGFTSTFNDQEFQAVGDFINFFTNDQGIDQEAMKKAIDFIINNY